MLSSKLFTVNTLLLKLKELQKQNQRIVFTNGCFDLLHPGHIDYLQQAKGLGDFLLIGLNSDDSVQRLKGKNRPINNQTFRMAILAALECVDGVILFEEDTPLNLIKKVTPSILVKGGDYKVEDIVGYKEVVNNNGKVVTIPFLEGYSSTQIINKIKALD